MLILKELINNFQCFENQYFIKLKNETVKKTTELQIDNTRLTKQLQ